MDKQAIRERNTEINAAIAAALDSEIGAPWGDAWHALIVTRGKRFGCVRTTKPPLSLHDGRAAVLWESWNHLRGQHAAARFGLHAHMSVFGLMSSVMCCSDPRASEAATRAGDIIQRAISNPQD